MDNKTGMNLTTGTASINLMVAPNPFNNTASVQFALFQPSKVTVKIIDMLGNQMTWYDNKTFEEGNISLPLSAIQLEGLAGSIYFVTVTVNGYSYSQKFVKL